MIKKEDLGYGDQPSGDGMVQRDINVVENSISIHVAVNRSVLVVEGQIVLVEVVIAVVVDERQTVLVEVCICRVVGRDSWSAAMGADGSHSLLESRLGSI